jgi:hypothetical protein
MFEIQRQPLSNDDVVYSFEAMGAVYNQMEESDDSVNLH